ncbi:hypothetical protein [Longimicrobium sp.]|uniref:hypothetical protein n=1 Tax=Longimicrobium sp. TaxID=2029185 RepID=UPI002C58A421|nr:hypothetical protein [Longimicrobium sp.]HSU14599.1 hypothetical protein [Longimicrobium sp.]
MNSSKKQAAVVLAAAWLLAAWAGQNGIRMEWMRLHDSVVPFGSSHAGFGKLAVIVSVEGYRARNARQGAPNAAAYHVMVTFAGADSVSRRWTSSASTGNFSESSGDDWWAWSGPHGSRRSLVTTYDAVRQRATIAGRRYSLSRGNLFVVRFDERGRASIGQIARTVSDTDPFRVLHIYQALLPSDPIVADVFNYPRPPCPRGTASTPRGGTA